MEPDNSVVVLTFEIDGVDHPDVQEQIANFVAVVQEKYERIRILDSMVMTGNDFYKKLENAYDLLDKIQEQE